MFGRKQKIIDQQTAEISALQEAIKALEQQNAELTEKVGSFESREHVIVKTLTAAAERADRMVSDAQREAGEILEQSKTDADTARRNAELVVDGAYQNARDIVKDAEAESQKKLDATQAQINNYAAMLTEYDKLVQENIRSAEENARRFADMAEKIHAALPQLLLNDRPIRGQMSEEATAAEPPAAQAFVEKTEPCAPASEDATGEQPQPFVQEASAVEPFAEPETPVFEQPAAPVFEQPEKTMFENAEEPVFDRPAEPEPQQEPRAAEPFRLFDAGPEKPSESAQPPETAATAGRFEDKPKDSPDPSGEEKIWTVSDIATGSVEELLQVEAIIDQILKATGEQK